jgi:outer membrane autotransporter protein
MTKVRLRGGVAFAMLPAGPAVSAVFSSTPTDVRRAVAAVIVALALSLAWPAAEAMALCAPAAVTGGSPSNTTVTCSGTVTNQNGSTGFGTGEQNNDTINVLAATTVTGSGPSPNIGAGLNLGTGNIVNLMATTSTVTGGNDGILTAGSITIMSSGTIFGSNAAILIFGTTTSNIGNSGTISSPDTAIAAFGTLNVTNSSSGIIQSTGPTGTAIVSNNTLTVNNAGIIRQAGVGVGSLGLLGPAGAMTNVTNSGTISGGMAAIDALGGATVINSGNLLAGMAGVATVGTTIVTNNQGGVIQATTAGASAGVLAMSPTAPTTVTNAGTISGNLDGVNTNTSATTTISNSGMINATTRDGLRVNSATFTNAAGGTLTGATGILFRAAAGTSSITNSGTITGTGGIAIDASAALGTVTTNQTAGTINGAIKLSANADVLNISGGTIAGNIVGQGTSNTINFAAGSGTFTYGSAFNFSTINQVNVSSGTAILDGTNSAAHVTVNGGALQIGDAANPGATLTSASPVDVVGGMLVGNGTLIGSATIEKGGALAPGAATPITTLTVTGNATFNAGSFYNVNVNATGQSDLLKVGGAAALGGTVQVLPQGSGFAPLTQYTILTAASVAGTFTNVNVPGGVFLVPSLSYTPDSVLLTLTNRLNSVAQSPNQNAVANAFTAGATDALTSALFNQSSSAGAQQAFNALSGEIYGSVQNTLADETQFARTAILDRLRQASYSDTDGNLLALSFGGPQLAYAADGARPGFPTKALPGANGAADTPRDLTFWSQGIGGWGHVDGDGNAATLKSSFGGFLAGADARFGDVVRAGFTTGYIHSTANVDARASSAGIDSIQFGAYAGAKFGAFNLRSGASVTFDTIDTSRTIAFPGIFETAQAHFDGKTGQVFGEVGYGLALNHMGIEPFAGLALVHLDTGSFLESTGLGALAGSNNSENISYSSLGLRSGTLVPLSNGTVLIPRVSVQWQHAFGDVTPAAALAFQSTGATFSTAGVPIAREAALLEGGFDWRLSPKVKLGIAYQGELAEHAQSHTVKSRLTWNF